jgi:elongation factor G
MCFVNKMDRDGADFYKDVQMMVDQLGCVPVPIQLPIGSGSQFKGCYDLVRQKSIVWLGDKLGAEFEEKDEIPEGMEDLVAEYREKMIETVVEQDEEVMEKFLEGEEPSVEAIKKCIRKGTIKFAFVPVLCGTAFKNKGVQPLLDAVIDYLPSPVDNPETTGKNPKNEEETLVRKNSDDEAFCGLAFKIAADPFVGTLTFFRIYSGSIKSGDMVFNPRTRAKERFGRMVLMHSNTREEIKVANAGDIIAVVGLKDTTTGDTLCAMDDQIVLEKMDFPEPVIKVAVEPKTSKDNDKMVDALMKLSAEDPSFRFSRDEESNQTVIEGMGELHLDIIVDRMKREFKVECTQGAPQVAYRETITTPHKMWYTHKKQTGGSGQYAKIQVEYSPNPGGGFEFVNEAPLINLPKEYHGSVIKGTEGELRNGIKAGYPTVDVKCTLLDGATHPVDSSQMAFEIAARSAWREGSKECSPKLLEPMMKVEVTTPEDYMGNVIGDLNSRRGIVQDMSDRGNVKLVKANVPLSEMFSYIATLRSLSKGRANFAMEFGDYQVLNEQLAEKLIGGETAGKKK